MPALPTPNSPNVAVLDSRIDANLCLGKFFIDASPTVYIGTGYDNVLGYRVKIVNPYGVTIRPYGLSYDIAPALSGGIAGIVAINIPTQAGKIQYGVYTISLQLTDEDSTVYEVTKSVNVCGYSKDQNPCDDRLQVISSCKNGTLTIYLSEPPVFRGFYVQSKTQSVVITYPTSSGVSPLTSEYGSFSVQLFEGVYKIVATVCATYNLTDNVLIRLPYSVTVEKNVKCLLDYTCIWPRIKQLNDRINENCSEAERQLNSSIVLDALRLIKTAELANDAGEDASPYINDLETLLGCVCTCDCSGSPIVNSSPSTNLTIEGCSVTKETVGLTDVYTIGPNSYILTVDPNQNIVTVSNPEINNCDSTQELSFSIANVYAGIKTQIGSQQEYNYWAGVIYNALNGLDTDCLTGPITSLSTLVQSIIDEACAGRRCNASILSSETSQIGADVQISWVQTNSFSVDVYVDGTLQGTVLGGVTEITIENFADGETHEYVLVPKCINGSVGTTIIDSFGYLACPSISPPVVSSNNVNGVECPYDLTALVSTPPVGITTEWHTANNTSAITLVPDPTAVSSGVYYAFAKDADGCYSTSTQVTVICAAETSCTAPQTLLVVNAVGGFKVSFQSAAFPPPANSYTVKRRLSADPDIIGSYTTIGTPVWNASTNRWEITDVTAVNNTLYTYRAISNCSSSAPYVDYQFANLTCPSLTLTPDDESIDYSFVPVGGSVDKYEVRLYDNTGTILIHTNTHLPSFSNPTTGTFLYLTTNTAYKVRIRVFIGSYYKDCLLINTITTGDTNNGIISNDSSGTINNLNSSLFVGPTVGSFPIETGEFVSGIVHGGVNVEIDLNITVSIQSHIQLYLNGILQECVGVDSSTNDYVFGPITFTSSDLIEIIMSDGFCP